MTNYGIIGCGMMGHEHLSNIALLDGTNIAAIYEPDREMAASAFKAAPNAIMTTSIEHLLSVSNLDCLVIASPNHCHMAQMQQIAGVTIFASFGGKTVVYRGRRPICYSSVF